MEQQADVLVTGQLNWTKKEETTNKEENSGSKYATKEDITKINNRIDELATKIDKLQKDNKEKTRLQ